MICWNDGQLGDSLYFGNLSFGGDLEDVDDRVNGITRHRLQEASTATGSARQVVTVAEHLSGAAAVASVGAVGAVFGGAVIMVDNGLVRLPTAWNARKEAYEVSGETVQTKHLQSMADLELSNRSIAMTNGALLSTAGIAAMCSEEVAEVFGYEALESTSLSLVGDVTGTGLGVFLFTRGLVVLKHGYTSYNHLAELEKEIPEDTQAAFSYLSSIHEEHSVYFKQIVGGTEPPPEKGDLKVQAKWVALVREGIYGKKLKHKIWMVMGTALIMAGICITAAGIAGLILGTGGLGIVVPLLLVAAFTMLGASPAFFIDDFKELFHSVRENETVRSFFGANREIPSEDDDFSSGLSSPSLSDTSSREGIE